MSRATRITIAVIIVIILVAIGGYWMLSRDGSQIPDTMPVVTPAAATAVTPAAEGRLTEQLRGVTLEGSDAVVRDVVATLSEQPEVVAWLANEDLVRRFVAAVHNIADGTSPRSHLDFLKPRGAFKVHKDGDNLVVDPSSWSRYDLATGVFVSIDTAGAARLLDELELLIDEAHSEIAPAGTSFRSTLGSAIDRLLAVPVPSGDEALSLKVVTYTYDDGAIESLPEVERQLLRLGPENVARIQAKLRELKSAFGL